MAVEDTVDMETTENDMEEEEKDDQSMLLELATLQFLLVKCVCVYGAEHPL